MAAAGEQIDQAGVVLQRRWDAIVLLHHVKHPAAFVDERPAPARQQDAHEGEMVGPEPLFPHDIKQPERVVGSSMHGEGSDHDVPREDILAVHLQEDDECAGYVAAHGVHFDQGCPNLGMDLERRSH
jgi:hypothetical protein